MADSRHLGIVVDLVGEVLHRRGKVCFTVSSSSMQPTLAVGDRVEARKLAGTPALGDLVVYRDPVLGCVVHRVIWRRPLWGAPSRIYTKGDNVPYRDPAVDPAQVLGTVGRIVRRGEELDPGRHRIWRVGASLVQMVFRRLSGAGNGPGGPPAVIDTVEEEAPPRSAGMVDAPGPRS